MGVFTAIAIVVYDPVKLFLVVVAFDGPVIPFAVFEAFRDSSSYWVFLGQRRW